MIFWEKSSTAESRLLKAGKLTYIAGKPYYQGRPLICSDSKIDGGVYVGSTAREAIVVDSLESKILPIMFEDVYTVAVVGGRLDHSRVLTGVYCIVKQTIKKSGDADITQVLQKYDIGLDEKVHLDVFLKEGVGACRQAALTCGVLLEMFVNRGLLGGKVSVDRNATVLGGHAWCRYTNSANEVFILDVAKNFFGSMEEGLSTGSWIYYRPDELRAIIGEAEQKVKTLKKE